MFPKKVRCLWLISSSHWNALSQQVSQEVYKQLRSLNGNRRIFLLMCLANTFQEQLFKCRTWTKWIKIPHMKRFRRKSQSINRCGQPQFMCFMPPSKTMNTRMDRAALEFPIDKQVRAGFIWALSKFTFCPNQQISCSASSTSMYVGGTDRQKSPKPKGFANSKTAVASWRASQQISLCYPKISFLYRHRCSTSNTTT